MDSSTEPPRSSAAQACPVVTIFMDTGGKRAGARGNGLPEHVVEAAAAAATPWRDSKHIARRLREFATARDLPGAAVWLQPTKTRRELPRPITVPFEPVELDETHPSIAAFSETTDPRGEAELARARRSSRIKRLMIRVGLPLGILLPQILNGIAQIVIHRKPIVSWIWGAAITLLLGIWILTWWYAAQWLLVPRGVVVRRSLVGKLGQRLSLHTADDTILIVRPHSPGWQAELWRDNRSQSRRLTDIECAVLLGAWQSTLPAPTREQLSDLS